LRYARRIDRISLRGEVLITDDSHMDTTGFDRVLYYKPPFGPYPAELAETYPFNAEVPEKADGEALGQAEKILRDLIRFNPEARFRLRLKGEGWQEMLQQK
jgi:7-cyano-7-deazaguanine tRNA-ribosyltransferase